MTFNLLPFIIALVGLAVVFYSLTVFGQKGKWDSSASFAYWASAALHAPHAAFHVWREGRAAFLGGGAAAEFLSLGMAVVYLITERKFKNRSFGLVVAPISFLALTFSYFHKSGVGEIPVELNSPLFYVHVPVFILGYAFFSLAFVSSVFYLLQERALKSKKIHSWVRRFPPLQAVDDLCYTLVSIGFPMITLGILSGSVWSWLVWSRVWSWEPKETLSLITWLVFAVYLHGRYLRGWRGRRTNLILIVGFVCILITYHSLPLSLMQDAKHTFIDP